MPLNKIVVIMTQSYKQGVHTVRPGRLYGCAEVFFN